MSLQRSTNSSKQGSYRPSPGLTLDGLNFKNLNKIPKAQNYPNQNKVKPIGDNIVKYSKIAKDEELQKHLANYELFFEKNNQNKNKQMMPSAKRPGTFFPRQPVGNDFVSKSDIYFPKNYKDSNAEILAKILNSGSEFSVNAPSNSKLYQQEIEQLKREENNKEQNNDIQMDTEGNEQQQMQIANSENEYQSQKNVIDNNNNNNNKLTINLSYSGDNLNDTYVSALIDALTLLDPEFETLSISEKITKLIKLTNDERRPARLGALICIYIILKKYPTEIDDQHKGEIIEQILSLLKIYNKQEEIFLVICLEICSLYGPIDILLENIGLICMFITDFNFPLLQKATFNCLMCMEYEGINTLIELASKDYQDYQTYILNNLIQTPHIQKIIIIRALLNEIYSNDSYRRNIALAALNRMHDLVDEDETLNTLQSLFNEPKVKKDFIASILRTSGEEGEMILLNEIKTNKDFNVRAAIANAFSYRIPKNKKYLDIRLDNNDAYSISNHLPGSFCTYHGKICPFIENKNLTIEQLLENDEYIDSPEMNTNEFLNENEEEYLEVNTRDFLAALRRMFAMNIDHSHPRLVHNGQANTVDNLNLKIVNNELLEKYFQLLDLTKVNEGIEDNEDINNNNDNNNTENDLTVNETGHYFLHQDIIKALSKCLKDYNIKVRETAATSLGLIGLPEALHSLGNLIENINDEDVNVKSKIIWAIGRIADGADNSIIPFITESVKCNMWKVKKASLYTLGQLGSRAAMESLPYLIKLLKESPINKQIIAETIVKLGLDGESVLLKLMNQETDANYKLKTAIVRALASADIQSTNIDFIVECVFRQGKNSNSLVRKAAIFAVKVLSEKAEDKITYLKNKNVIPFYYDKLKDKECNIQQYAIYCIKSLGPQGELIFIEGLVNDPNPVIRANCAIGLGEIGVHTIRTLLVGLHDEEEGVRSTVEKVIVTQMNISDVVNYFVENDEGQLASLKIAIKDIVENNYPLSMFAKNYLNQLLEEIEKVK